MVLKTERDVVLVLAEHKLGITNRCVNSRGMPCADDWVASKRAPSGTEGQHRLHVADVLARSGLIDHRPVSLGGWRCDICDDEVNGQTDENGDAVQRGETVRHTDGKWAS